MLLVQAIRRNAAFFGAAEATVEQGVSRNWAQFVDRVARAAGGLRRLGVAPGDRVGILALNSASYLEAQFAIWWAGAVVVPMNVRWSLDENIYSARDAGVETLVVDEAFAETALAIAAQQRMRLVRLDGGRGAFAAFEDLASKGSPVPAYETPADALAGIYYTGGTTGFPKGVMLSHRALWSAAVGVAVATRMTQDARVLHAAPMFHLADGALSMATTLLGAAHVFVPRFDPAEVVEAIEASAVTVSLLVPTMISMLQASEAYAPSRLRTLRMLLFGASPISAAVLTRLRADLPDLDLLHVYGQTEMGPTVSYLDPRHQVPGGPKMLSVGQPFPGVEVRIVDEAGADSPVGAPGEILARGPSAMTGYWNKPEETASVMADGWVRTGDVAYKDADGFLFICDRAKDMIITGGENVFSAEVENAVASHPAVAQVAVIGVPDPEYGERVHAVVVLRPGETLTLDELTVHCGPQIANYKRPRSLELRDALPISGAGKVLKRDLRAPHWAGLDRAVH